MRRAGALVLCLGTAWACHAPRVAAHETEVVAEALGGVTVRLAEVTGRGTYPLVPDHLASRKGHRVDASSSLRVTFEASPERMREQASPRWRTLERCIELLDRTSERCIELNQRAAALPPEAGEETERLIQDYRALDRLQQTELIPLMLGQSGGPALMDEDEFDQRFLTEWAGDPYVGMARFLNAELEALQDQPRVSETPESADDVVVVVRARLRPLVGDEQFLAIPDYYELGQDGYRPGDQERSAELARLRAEFEAARSVAGAIRELQTNRAELRAFLGTSLERWVETLRAWLAGFQGRARTLVGELDAIASGLDPGERALEPDEMRLREDVARLRTDVQGLVDFAGRVQALVAALGGRGLDSLLGGADLAQLLKEASDLGTEAERLLARIGDGQDGWGVLLPRIARDAATVLARDVSAEWNVALRQLGMLAAGELGALASGLAAELPETTKALQLVAPTLRSGGPLLAGLDELRVPPGNPIPRPLDDLPPAVVDLDDYAIAPGDRVVVTVEFWRRGAFQEKATDVTRRPVESIRYTLETVKTGWIWSGDVVFTRQLENTGGEAFTANAAVSREWRRYDRARPTGLWNRLNPAFGFHAAQLNQDPDESVEFGVGVNASLWGGLLRGGVGYNLSSDADQEYFFVGFGLISALNLLRDVGSKAFDAAIAD